MKQKRKERKSVPRLQRVLDTQLANGEFVLQAEGLA